MHANQSAIHAIFTPDTPLSSPVGSWINIHVKQPAVLGSYIVPRQAIYHNNQVYRIDDQKLKAVSVTIHGHLAYDNSQVIISSPALNNDDTILTTPLPNATTGLYVSLAKDSTP